MLGQHQSAAEPGARHRRLAWVLGLLLLAPAFAVRALSPGSPAPEIRLPVMGGNQQLDLSDLQGQAVYVDFWASWCGPCRQSLPLYESLYQEFSPQGFTIVAINLDEDEQDAEKFLQKHPVSYTVLLDPHGSAAAAWEIRVMPTSFLLDRDGNVVKEYAGFQPSHIADIRNDIQTLLKP